MPTHVSTAASDRSILVIIDIQQKLAAAMPRADRERVIARNAVLLAASEALSVPVLVTEQYPKGLGPTEEAVRDRLPAATRFVEKTAFSAARVDAFSRTLEASGRKQVLLTGMETHICVLQTALDLCHQGYRVHVLEDAVCSRSLLNHDNALQRLRHAGVIISNVESALFEWLGDASHPEFKALAKLIA